MFSIVAAASLVTLKPNVALEAPWAVAGSAPAAAPVDFIVSLKRNADALKAFEERTLRAADPNSPTFRDWANEAEAAPAQSPAPGAVAAVTAWLTAHDIHRLEVSHSSVSFATTARQAELIFGAKWVVARNAKTGQTRLRANGDLVVPPHIASAVETVFGAHGLPLPPNSRIGKNSTRAGDAVPVGPEQIRKLYDVTTKRGSGSTSVRQAVAEFQGQYIEQSDLTTFFNMFVPDAQHGDNMLWKTIGQKGSGAGIEALLDVEYIMGIALGVKTEFWSYQGFDFCSDLKKWTTAMLQDTADQPSVISISYGWQGPTSQIGCTSGEVMDIDKDFMLLAGKGVTIVFASGDSGSGYSGGKIYPSWPASSPYVLAVGATSFSQGMGSPPSATTQFGSGSGFSDMFNASSWQQRPVGMYLQKASGLPPASAFPKGGRPTADVSALGEGFKVVVQGSVEIVGGTSASAPTFSAILALIDDSLQSAGKKKLGYVNQWLYSMANDFTDVTIGTDKISRAGQPVPLGFDCTTGWDPATGLGTPVYSKLKDAAMSK